MSWELDENVPLIMADAGRMEQVFINLFINARDAIEDHWTEFGKGREIERQEKDLYPYKDRKRKGIPSDSIDKIFEPFYTTKEVGKGTGLGLSISYGIIKDCGGTIEAVSSPGKGASFIITFPVVGG